MLSYLLNCLRIVNWNIKKNDNKLAKANNAFGRLHKQVRNNNHMRKLTKIRAYRAMVITTLLYGSESWFNYCHHLQLPSTLSLYHLLHPMKKLHHKCRGAGPSRDCQHQIHAVEVSVKLGKPHVLSGGLSVTKDYLYRELSISHRGS